MTGASVGAALRSYAARVMPHSCGLKSPNGPILVLQGGLWDTGAMNRRTLIGLIVAAATTFAVPAAAQNDRAPALSTLLRRLQRDPAYQGRIVGTHVVRPQRGTVFLYEVRILSPDDRIVIVYLDPETGAVVNNPDAWLRRRSSW